MLDFNQVCECQIAATLDGKQLVKYPRLRSVDLRRQLRDAHQRGLLVLAVALYNCSTGYVYSWHDKLQNKHWLDRALTMRRIPGEYHGTQDVLYLPAVERRYTLDSGRLKLLTNGAFLCYNDSIK